MSDAPNTNGGHMSDLPTRDLSIPSAEQGVYRKYDVTRVDGKQDPADARYFVLRVGGPNPDPLALTALGAYADAAADAGFTALASDLRNQIATTPAEGAS